MKLQKLFAVMILMLFMMSIMPVALAEDTTGNGEIDDTTEDNGESAVEIEEETKVKPREKFRRDKVVHEARVRSKLRVEHARERFQDAREHYREARERFREHRGSLSEIRQEVRNCQEDDCEEIKTRLRKGVRQHLIKTGDLIERSLAKLSAKIENSDLADDEKTATLERIAELEADLAEKKAAVAALKEEGVTNEELRAAIKDLRKSWKEIRKEQKAIVSGLINSRLDNIVEEKLPRYEDSMQAKVAEVADLGGDTAEMERLLEVYKSNLADLETTHARSKEIWSSFKVGDVTIEEWREAHQVVREDLKEVRKSIREFMKVYRDEMKDLRETEDHSEEETTEE